MTNNLPVVGAAMRSENLPHYVEWLIADQRDLEIQDPAAYYVLDGDWRSNARNVKSMLDGYTGRVGIHGPFYSLTLAALDPKIRAVVIERLKQGLDYAAEIGGTHMVVHSPHEFLGTPFQPLAPTASRYDYMSYMRETLEPVVRHAEQIGCALVMETIYDRDMRVWIDSIKAFESPCFLASVDVGHAYINHQFGAPPPDYWVREAGSLIGHLHLQDNDGFVDRHWVPGDGSVNFRAVFDAIRLNNVNPRLIIEVTDQTQILRAAQWFADQGLAR